MDSPYDAAYPISILVQCGPAELAVAPTEKIEPGIDFLLDCTVWPSFSVMEGSRVLRFLGISTTSYDRGDDALAASTDSRREEKKTAPPAGGRWQPTAPH